MGEAEMGFDEKRKQKKLGVNHMEYDILSLDDDQKVSQNQKENKDRVGVYDMPR